MPKYQDASGARLKQTSAARSKHNRIERLVGFHSDNTELEREYEELAEANKKKLELLDKIKAVEYSKIAVLSYLQIQNQPRDDCNHLRGKKSAEKWLNNWFFITCYTSQI